MAAPHHSSHSSQRNNVVALTQRDRVAYLDTSRNEDVTSLRFYADATRELNRVWRRHLTLAEYGLLAFIVDNTVGWRRLSHRFTARFIEHGDHRTCGLGLKRRQVGELVKSLEEKRFIVVDRAEAHLGLLIHVNIEWNEDMLPTPERLKTVPEAETHTSSEWFEGHEGCAENCAPLKRNFQKKP
ncbi:hypothetical protein [Aquibium oceanicum]|uniref:Uncharacterized protein n=1 Tax=Aquibium oceanicum TaxID=1670800 RepID=A0A1L3SNG4_9HYPH|nr:hypothetical protein [Aquibium oceanicum]APH70943.1 hypothetical protein BSQ44_05785 [Aquibium oceanicum]